MRNNQQEFEEKKKELFEAFLQNEPDESDAERDQALENLVFELVRVQYGIADTSEERINQIRTFVKAKMAEMECNDPRLAHSVNGLNKIGRSQYGEASKYIDELFTSIKEDFVKAQTRRGNAPKKPDQLNLTLESFVKSKPDITTNEALERINGLKNNGVIIDIVDGEIIYTNEPPHGEKLKQAKISGLYKRINKIKKQQSIT